MSTCLKKVFIHTYREREIETERERDREVNESLIERLTIISLRASSDPSHHLIVLWSVGSINSIIVRQAAPPNHKQAAACLFGRAYWRCQMCLSCALIRNHHSVRVIEKAKKEGEKKSAMELRWQRLYGKTHKPLRESVLYDC